MHGDGKNMNVLDIIGPKRRKSVIDVVEQAGVDSAKRLAITNE